MWLMYFESTDWVIHTTDAVFGVWRKRYAKGKVRSVLCCDVLGCALCLAVPDFGVVFLFIFALPCASESFFCWRLVTLGHRKIHFVAVYCAVLPAP